MTDYGTWSLEGLVSRFAEIMVILHEDLSTYPDHLPYLRKIGPILAELDRRAPEWEDRLEGAIAPYLAARGIK